jgi:hypothetical protein
MIGNKLEWYSKAGYDVVKEKMCCSVNGVVEGGHSFCPFGEVINDNNNVFVTIAGGGITSHEVDAPFTKRVGSDEGMKKSRGSSGFIGVEMTLLTSFHGMNAIVKQGRPKVTGSDNILSSGYARKMAPTCTALEVV